MPSYRIRRPESLCSECPFAGHKKVYGICEQSDTPSLIILGEAPGENEEIEGKPFVGEAGSFLQRAVAIAGLNWKTIYKTNVILCRPPHNDISTFDAKEAIRWCRPGLLSELDKLKGTGSHIVMPAGNTAINAFNLDGKISKIRGSVYSVSYNPDTDTFDETPDGDFVLIPTYHPSFIMRGQWKEEPTWVNDIQKAAEISTKGWDPPKENFNIFPTLDDIKEFADRAVKNKSLIGVDIETIGLNPRKSKIVLLGLSISESEAIVIPFYKKGLRLVWSDTQYKKVVTQINRILSTCPTIYQDALFDVRHLEHHGFTVGNIQHDVMLLHHCISPELPHNLGYIVSVYGATPYWKDIVLKSEKAIRELNDTVFRTYNARDAVVLHQVLPSLIEDAEGDGTYHVYENISMPLIHPIKEMMDNGIKISKHKLTKYRDSLIEENIQIEKGLRKLLHLPESFSFTSGDDLRKLIYNKEPAKVKRAEKELLEYEKPNTRRKKNTKKYRELQEIALKYPAIKPLWLPPRYKPLLTDSKLPATDKMALQSIRIAINNRLDELSKIKKPKTHHVEETAELKKTALFIDEYLKLSKIEKLLSTYTTFPIGSDGRVHGSYLIHGTATGRLSSREPNMQNIDIRTKEVFTCDKGNILIQADFSNLEARVLAYDSDDKVLINQLEQGLNLHTENCKTMFGLSEDDPLWKAARHACKTYIFGRNYGGTVRGIFKKVVIQVPELNLTFNKFKQVDEAYRNAHPAYVQWGKKIISRVNALSKLCNSFGRVRIFLGTPAEVERAALNFPIQSNAGDIMNLSLIEIHRELTKRRKKDPSWEKVKLLGTVHDSVLVEAPKAKKKAVISLLKKHMETPRKIGDYEVSFPVDFETGTFWGSLKEEQL